MLKSKNKYSGLFIALGLMVGLSGCPDWVNVDGNNTVENQEIDKRATIQGAVFDATTGARLGGNDLKMTLVQGSSDRSPSKLNRDTNSDLMGEYAFADVPVNVDGGNITFKMVITKTGYQRFEGTVTYNVAEGDLVATTDKIINLIRDVYLFPVGATAPDIEVAVEFDREPVPGAIVALQQRTESNVASVDAAGNGNRLLAASGLIPTLTATTDAAGKVTFAGASLVLGGAYRLVVLPIKHEGVPLARFIAGANIIAGTATSPTLVSMSDTTPSGNDDGIFVVFASNRDTDDITGLTNPGVLTLVFNRPVELNNVTGNPFTATLVNAGAAVLNGAGTSTSVSGVLSVDGLTLTLTPQFTTAPIATDVNLDAVFAGGQLTVAGDEGAQGKAVFGLSYLDGVIISGTVNVTGPGA